jgi:hypothetical protein
MRVHSAATASLKHAYDISQPSQEVSYTILKAGSGTAGEGLNKATICWPEVTRN